MEVMISNFELKKKYVEFIFFDLQLLYLKWSETDYNRIPVIMQGGISFLQIPKAADNFPEDADPIRGGFRYRPRLCAP